MFICLMLQINTFIVFSVDILKTNNYNYRQERGDVMVETKQRRNARMNIKLVRALFTLLLFVARYARNKEEIIKVLEEVRKDLK